MLFIGVGSGLGVGSCPPLSGGGSGSRFAWWWPHWRGVLDERWYSFSFSCDCSPGLGLVLGRRMVTASWAFFCWWLVGECVVVVLLGVCNSEVVRLVFSTPRVCSVSSGGHGDFPSSNALSHCPGGGLSFGVMVLRNGILCGVR